MSAFVVSDQHVCALLTFASLDRRGVTFYLKHQALDCHKKADLQTAAQILKDQCIKSVMIRYPKDTLETLPGPNDLRQEIEFTYSPHPTLKLLKPVDILSACSCYDYQACEDPDYGTTPARQIIETIRNNAVRRLPGYEQVAWEITEPV